MYESLLVYFLLLLVGWLFDDDDYDDNDMACKCNVNINSFNTKLYITIIRQFENNAGEYNDIMVYFWMGWQMDHRIQNALVYMMQMI